MGRRKTSRVQEPKFPTRRTRTITQKQRDQSIHKLRGEHAPFLDLAARATDKELDMLYLFGGSDSKDRVPKPWLWRLDLRRLVWEDLSMGLKFRESLQSSLLTPMLLPARVGATMQIYRKPGEIGQPRVIIFGGKGEDELPSSDVISVDIENLTWTKLDHEEGIVPRVAATSVICGDRLFVFGGWTRSGGIEEDARTLNSYAVFDLVNQIWTVKEEKWKEDIGVLGYKMQSLGLFGDRKILLLRGRVDFEDEIDEEKILDTIELTSADIFLFDTRSMTIHPQDQTTGAFPVSISWCEATRLSPSQALVCVWSPNPDCPKYLQIELYRLNCFPVDTWKSLAVKDWVWERDQDLQMFEVAGDKLLLFGSQPDRDGKQTWNICVDVTEVARGEDLVPADPT